MTTADPPPARPQAAALLVLAGLCAYASSFTGDFILDDCYWIQNNAAELSNPGEFTLSWLPARWLVAMTIELNFQLGGLDVFGYHLFNVAVHVLAGLTLFGVVRRTLLLPRWRGRFERS